MLSSFIISSVSQFLFSWNVCLSAVLPDEGFVNILLFQKHFCDKKFSFQFDIRIFFLGGANFDFFQTDLMLVLNVLGPILSMAWNKFGTGFDLVWRVGNVLV